MMMMMMMGIPLPCPGHFKKTPKIKSLTGRSRMRSKGPSLLVRTETVMMVPLGLRDVEKWGMKSFHSTPLHSLLHPQFITTGFRFDSATDIITTY